ncbi:protein kinase domain-containing protein [Haliangium sp.]|uniref:nSTAND1 domain-containing NTPase n=1 Tax=Haliangium sp. TaxID=2663208 RepID=UPI003D0B7DF6
MDLDDIVTQTASGEEPPERRVLTGRTLGDFQVGALLGHGGFGAVYQAWQTTLSREVVVKALHRRGSERDEHTRRFLREATLASRLDHPYAAHVYAFGAEPDGLLWIAMEMVRGTPLSDLLRTQGPLPPDRFVPLFEKICEVAYTAHQQGIVHRDIKPSNVMVISRAGKLLPKLLDFGIARVLDDDDVRAAAAAEPPLPPLPALVAQVARVLEVGPAGAMSEGDVEAVVATEVKADTTAVVPAKAEPEPDTADEADEADEAEPEPDAADEADTVAAGTDAAEEEGADAGTSEVLGAAVGSDTADVSDTASNEQVDTALTRRGRFMGSPPYMAPEQWADASRADARTDQYALGILAFEALVGEPPFHAPTFDRIARAHISEPVPSLGEGFPPGLDAVLARALAKEPERRYPDVLAFAAALQDAVEGDHESSHLPQLAARVREGTLARAPQPLADSIALLEAVRTPARAVDAAFQVVRVSVRLLALYAVAAFTRLGADADTARGVGEALRRLQQSGLTTAAWWEVAGALLTPFASTPDVHPVPELVLLFHATGDEAAPLERMAALVAREVTYRAEPEPSAEASMDMLSELLDEVAFLLEQLSFLSEYPIAVARGDGGGDAASGQRAESWMGARRAARAALAVRGQSALAVGEVVLVTSDGSYLLTLSPLCQLLTPAPGAAEELFLFDGPGRYGARLVAFPVGFERHDDRLWTWYRDHLVDLDQTEGEAAGLVGSAERAPYMGLATFGSDDADSYFGREHEVEAAVNRLRVSSLLTVVGPSGAGKSSFVRAGIAPALAGSWQTVITRPGPTPLASLGGALEDLAPAATEAVRAGEKGALAEALRARARGTGRGVLLVVDQFEELLTLCHDGDEQRAYAQALMDAAGSADEQVRVVLTLRDDFLLRAQQIPALRERLGQSLVLLATPPPDELVRILVEPARRVGYEFEDERLAEEMVATVVEEPGALALLSFTAAKLWDLRDHSLRRLTRRAYKALGGVGGALAQHAEETLDAMSPRRRELVREAFRQLVTADGTRAVLRRAELGEILGGGDAAEEVLEDLIHARLVVASEGVGGEDRIEVVHEALLRSWPRLVAWQREDAEGARLRDQLRAAARQWDERGRARGMVWRGEALLEYRVWRARYRGSLTETEEAFARASLGEEARGRWIRRVVVIAAFAALSAGLLVVLEQRDRAGALAERVARERDRAAALAEESKQRLMTLYLQQGRQALAGGDATRALPYLAEAYQEGVNTPALRFLLGRATQALAGQLAVLRGHERQVWSVRVSPDGRRVATASADRSARIWDGETGALLHTLTGFDLDVWRVSFSPDGTRLMTASWDGSVKLWEVESGALLWEAKHGGRVFAAEFSHDGTMVASVGATGEPITLRDASDGRVLRELSGYTGGVARLVFSPDDTLLVAASGAPTALVWRVAGGARIPLASAGAAPVVTVAISPDGATVASSHLDGVVRLVDLRTGARKELLGHDGIVYALDFSPDGALVASAGEDGSARVWTVASGEPVYTFADHGGTVHRVRFTVDSRAIFTVSDDGHARRWSVVDGQIEWTFMGHRGGLQALDLAPSGAVLVTGGADGTVRVWRADQQRYALRLPAEGKGFSAVAFEPGGGRVATIDLGGRVRVWDRSGQPALSIETGDEFQGVPLRVLWSPDGTRLLSSGGPKARMWDARSGVHVRDIEHDQRVLHAGWTPDGGHILTSGSDNAVDLWDANSGSLQRRFTGHSWYVVETDVDPSGRRLATAGLDDTVRIWELATARVLHTLHGHSNQVLSVHYSPDGERLLTTAGDATGRLWSAEGVLLHILEGHTSRVNEGAFVPSGELVATGSQAGATTVWDSRSGTALWTIHARSGGVSSVDFSADGRYLAFAAADAVEIVQVAAELGSPAEVAEFSRCRTEYSVDDGQLTRIQPDPARCSTK